MRELCLTLLALVVIALPATSQVWHRVGGDYPGIDRDDNIVLAVGRSGAILRSTDNGSTWSIPSSGTWADLRFVDMSPDGRLWAWGANATALASTDAGETWSQLAVPPFSVVDAFSVAGPNSAFAIVDSTRVLRTTDAGISWAEMAQFPGIQALSLSMIDANHGVAVAPNGRIYSTSDGAATWTLAFNEAGVNLSSAALDPQGHGVACGYGGAILVTSDSGRTWAPRGGPGSGIDGLACAIQNDRAIVVGALGTGSTLGVIAGSSDRGETWSLEIPDLKLQGGHALTSVSISPNGREAASGNLGTVLLHSPGEQYWKPSTSSMVSEQVGFLPTLKYGAYSSSDTAVVSHSLLTIAWLRTTDGGITWRTHFGSNASDQFAEIAFFDRTDGVAIVNGFRRRSTNAGLTWQQVGFGVQATPRSVEFLSRSHWLMASDGGVRRSIDSGDTWSLVPLEVTPFMMFVRKTAAGFAVAAGRTNPGDTVRPLTRALYRSDDGGQSWRTILLRETGRNIIAADFTDDVTGVAISDSILRTTDGGETWTSSASPAAMTSIRFFNSRDGIIVGFNNLILRTSDAGATWQRDSIWAPDPNVQYPAFEDVILSQDRITLLALGRGVIGRLVLPEPLTPASADESNPPLRSVNGLLGIRPLPSRDGRVEFVLGELITGKSVLGIYDLMGRLVAESRVENAGRLTLDLSDLSNGAYRAVLCSNGKYCSNWLIIARP
ncbi:MAG TPA: YCF48-related protein [Vicinamibacterales bacterium]|nr:YCF48-related protein [Vicinamibacterales bacterium]